MIQNLNYVLIVKPQLEQLTYYIFTLFQTWGLKHVPNTDIKITLDYLEGIVEQYESERLDCLKSLETGEFTNDEIKSFLDLFTHVMCYFQKYDDNKKLRNYYEAVGSIFYLFTEVSSLARFREQYMGDFNAFMRVVCLAHELKFVFFAFIFDQIEDENNINEENFDIIYHDLLEQLISVQLKTETSEIAEEGENEQDSKI